MSWSHCGIDSKGRPIGYAHSAKCDHPGCEVEIDRGLSYACGGMHGINEIGCESYFCPDHLAKYVEDESAGLCMVCQDCANDLLDSGDWHEDEDSGDLVRNSND